MKRTSKMLALLLAASLLFTGCSKKEEEPEVTSEPSQVVSLPEPESSVPEPEPAPLMGVVVNVVDGSYANVRSAPSMDGEVIGMALPAQRFEILGQGVEGVWVKIAYQDQEGYIHQDYFQPEDSLASSTPETSTAA